jgi:aspartyl-tRNA(Asn)/glutamyl-tRNA(Gln) amidotransferase subunit A
LLGRQGVRTDKELQSVIDSLEWATAAELLAGYRSGEVSPVEATRAALDAIARHDADINAFCLVEEESALAAARESEERWLRNEPRGLADGVPTSIKDLMLTKGWPTLRGSRLTSSDGDWSEDAPAVARLRETGAVLLGKVTSPDFGWKGVTDSPGAASPATRGTPPAPPVAPAAAALPPWPRGWAHGR